jgi:thiol-disulfide isomerase/thioredoxin
MPILTVGLILSFSSCTRQAQIGPTKAATATQGQGEVASPPREIVGDKGLATTVSDVARPWYADRLEKLGFYVFPAPVDVGDFSAEALKGGAATLAASRGKVVLLNFWATWCPPCRSEMPSIEALSKKMKGKNFTIMAISVGEDKAIVEKFIAEQKYSYPIFLDPSNALGTAFNASSIPTTYLIDKQGKVIAGIQGSREYDGPDVVELFKELAEK